MGGLDEIRDRSALGSASWATTTINVDRTDAIDPFFVTAYYTAMPTMEPARAAPTKASFSGGNGFARFALHTSRSFRTNQYSLLSGTMVG